MEEVAGDVEGGCDVGVRDDAVYYRTAGNFKKGEIDCIGRHVLFIVPH